SLNTLFLSLLLLLLLRVEEGGRQAALTLTNESFPLTPPSPPRAAENTRRPQQ
ncbi:hypothetical protein Pmani_029821, partial [Petrolisthes manimaculis]